MLDALIEKVEQSASIGIRHHTHGNVGKQASESDGKEQKGFELFPDSQVDQKAGNQDHERVANRQLGKPSGS